MTRRVVEVIEQLPYLFFDLLDFVTALKNSPDLAQSQEGVVEHIGIMASSSGTRSCRRKENPQHGLARGPI
jgi:hypothetical protein